jgi:glycosyltransferase involved in cell wall biosynthesis
LTQRIDNQVCVLVPHYNAPEALQRSLGSIGSSEKTDVLVVDDGSTKPLDEDELRASARFEGRVYFLYLSQNQGIANALNAGLAWLNARSYAYIARLDCGDLCQPERLQKQVYFLEQNPAVALVGSWAIYVNEAGREILRLKLPTTNAAIRRSIFLACPFVHPSIMFRAAVLQKVSGYDPSSRFGEDYPFYFEVIKHFEVANLPEFLLTYQVSQTSMSSQNRALSLQKSLQTLRQNFYWGWWPVVGMAKHLMAFLLPRPVVLYLRKCWY